jgi:hypothetical protein
MVEEEQQIAPEEELPVIVPSTLRPGVVGRKSSRRGKGRGAKRYEE